jgi:hypothetical protein
MGDDRTIGQRWHLGPVPTTFVFGVVLGWLWALVARPRDDVFITNSWSYVPAEQWWLHGLLVGTSLALVALAILVGLLIAAFLMRRTVLFTVVGAFLVAMAGTFVVLGWFGEESGADRALWFVLALLVGGIGAPMIITEYRFRRRRTA